MRKKTLLTWLMFSGLFLSETERLLAQDIPTLFPESLSPRIANYNIDVKLDADARKIDGQEVLIWHNKTSDTIDELQFHMYLNAFRNSETTFMKGSGGEMRGSRIGTDGWGYIEADRITVAYGSDLKRSIQYLAPSDAPEILEYATDVTEDLSFIQPDDGNENDKSVFRIPLPKPLPPGETVVVNIDFTAKLPSPPFARTGAKEEYFFVGQWFPKIGVYTDKGWNTHQFHPTSEFFADYGVYNVRMTVPEANIVGATGVEVDVRQNGDGTATHFYHAEDVHDFAWTTSPEYQVHTTKSQDVDIRVLLQPDRYNQAERHLKAAEVAVAEFQNRYGDYPFPNLTVVDPRRGAGGSGGMEYPTLITAGTSYGMPKGLRALEHVILHEFGHNYWYHLLASNEFEEAWLDEGVNTYTDITIIGELYGDMGDLIDFLGIKVDYIQIMRGAYLSSSNYDQIITPAWKFYNGNSYGTNSYGKPGIVLTTLRNYLGHELMQEAMRTYVERWRFKHPTSEDFFAVMEEVAGEDLDWFFDQAFRSAAVLDYSVSSVSSRPVRKGRGFDFTMPIDADTTMTNGDAAADGDSESTATDSLKMYTTVVKVRRIGDFKFPVEVEFVFEDGETERDGWDGDGYWTQFEFEKPSQLLYATVDPDGKIPIDINYTNNSRSVKTQRLGVNKLSARWMFWIQSLLDQPELVNFFPLFSQAL